MASKQTIQTNIAKNLFNDALITGNKPKLKYFKVSYDTTATPDPTWTDIPNAVLTKDITGIFKVNDHAFRIYYEVLETEVTDNVALLGTYDENDNLLFITKFDPPITVQQTVYFEITVSLTNFETVIDINLVPWDEYEQTLSIIDTLNSYDTIIQDIVSINLNIKDLDNRITNLENNSAAAIVNTHNNDPQAHPLIQQAMAAAGIYIDKTKLKYVGQFFDLNASFDGTVVEDDIVYKDVDGLYKPAIIDGTNKQNVVGIAKKSEGKVIVSGLIEVPNQNLDATFNIGDKIYLSDTDPGKITKNQTLKELGYYLGNNVILFGSVGSGGGKGEVTFEDLQYYMLLFSSNFDLMYYDIFSKPNTINIQTGTVTYDAVKSSYVIGTNGGVLETNDIINNPNETYYRFAIHLELEDTNNLPTVEYSTDSGTNWITVTDINNIVLVRDGFNKLRLKFTFNSANTFYSYGVLYKYVFTAYSSDTRMLEVLDVQQNIPAGTPITLPNGASYTNDGKSLEVYLNKLRLYPNVDYIEVDHRTVKFNIDLVVNDKILFTEKYGYVDTSVENYQRLNTEHDIHGYHIFTDLTTGEKYRLAVDNGTVVLIKVV